jgi:hypothetical protein
MAEFGSDFGAFGAPGDYMATLCQTTRLRAVSAPTVAILASFLAGTFQASDVLESILDYTSRNAAQALARGGV